MKNKNMVLNMIDQIRNTNLLSVECDMDDIDPVAKGWIMCHEATLDVMLTNLKNHIAIEEEEF